MAELGAIEVVGKIRPRDICNPKKLVGQLKDGDERVVGKIHGLAYQIINRTMANGDVTEGLAGKFEALTEDGRRIQSGVLYLPTNLQPFVHSELRPDDDGNVRSNIAFAFALILKTDTNPQGYTWSMRSLMKPSEVDPLVETRKAIEAAPAVAKLADHRKRKA